MTTYFNTAAAGAVITQNDALKAMFNAGKLQIWTDAQVSSGKDPDVAFSGTKLAEFTFSATAFGSAGTGSLTGSFPSKIWTVTASFSASTVTALASGTAATFGLVSSGAVLLAAGSVGTSGADINFNSVAFSSGANITLSSFTLVMPE
jgi:hypothetical protein